MRRHDVGAELAPPLMAAILFGACLIACATLALWEIDVTAQQATVTFNRDIAPIVRERCAGCHRPGESAPFSLLTYADVRHRAAQIGDVTARRYMPPWKPEPGFGDFAGARRLSDEEIALFRRWADQGALEGDTTLSGEPPLTNGDWPL